MINADIEDITAMRILKAARFWNRARKDYFNIKVRSYNLAFSNLPKSFSGKRILFLADIHYPGREGFHDKVMEIIKSLDFDYCFLGGDYAWGDGEFPVWVCRFMNSLLEEIKGKKAVIHSILGNHDSLFIAEHLEKAGAGMLINSSALIESPTGEKICVAGLGDHHNLHNDDWDAMISSIEAPDAFRILLCHNPNYYSRAQQAGFALMLAGHTHAGQFCLPSGIPVYTNCRAPMRYARGQWKYKNLVGITTAGAGSSRLTARLNCPGEISIVTLLRDKNTL
ncbi:phosphodiesterase YaeI [Sedimentisphaera cyanobacteriorum]|uniref:Phosphodiesterase YaeI n=1 Tax=Sedimentisphaera cyanobacteriorum TaxID=1940790 RepID=A0A1Q2HN69_9BACT|nr:metallophosphoesterase [Sedimentisphaera cyanobacteriorum]AQQ08800.1 phosphodiesterase YaeI [Sedimentisphaera cyanobacteriorum]